MATKVKTPVKSPLTDGISRLPKQPGVYAILNRVTRKLVVGQSGNVKQRCMFHRSQMRAGGATNMRMRNDTERHGSESWFYFALQVLDAGEHGEVSQLELDHLERWWSTQLQASSEGHGYVSEAGRIRTLGARFRDRERKLMRPNSRKYQLLPGVSMHDPINSDLLASWVPGS